jgi:ATP-binding cassette, subfamily F, member 1
MELREEVHELEERLKADDIGDGEAAEIGDQLAPMYEELEEEGNSTAEARASRILHGLGFTEAMRQRTTKSFSGGWRMRISLARALFISPTLLMLDEPTNHLDLRAVLWLEEYLTRCANFTTIACMTRMHR